jgi:hypothetical protein
VIDNVKAAKPLTNRQLLEVSGYARSTIEKHARQTFTSEAFQDALAKRGFTPEKLLKIYDDAGEAEQGSWFQGKFYKDNEPDHNIRLKAASGLADILGVKKRLVETKTVNVHLTGEDLKQSLGLG